MNRKAEITSAVTAVLLWLWMATMNGLELAAYSGFVIFTWITVTAIVNVVFKDKK